MQSTSLCCRCHACRDCAVLLQVQPRQIARSTRTGWVHSKTSHERRQALCDRQPKLHCGSVLSRALERSLRSCQGNRRADRHCRPWPVLGHGGCCCHCWQGWYPVIREMNQGRSARLKTVTCTQSACVTYLSECSCSSSLVQARCLYASWRPLFFYTVFLAAIRYCNQNTLLALTFHITLNSCSYPAR